MHKKLIATSLVGLTLFVAACGGSPSASTSPSGPAETTSAATASAPESTEATSPEATVEESTPATETSPGEPSESPAETPAEGADTFEVPADLGVPVETMPLMPGATAELGYRDIGQTWKITNPGKTADDIKAWYVETLKADGYEVEMEGNIVEFEKTGLSGQIVGLQDSVVFEMRADKN